MKKILYILILSVSILYCNTIHASVEFDTSQVILNAKMNIIKFNNSERTKEILIGLINSKCNYSFLQARGFNNVVFFSINLSHDTIANNTFSYRVGNNYDYNFIFGYNIINHTIYKLKGFEINDFGALYNFLKKDNLPDHLEPAKNFIKNFYVDKLDLYCLYAWYKKCLKKKCLLYNRKCVIPAQPIYSGIQW